MRIVSTEALAARWPQLATLLPCLCLSRRHDTGLVDDPLAGAAFRNYVSLTDAARLLADLHLTPEQVFYGRYYWFVRLAAMLQAREGRIRCGY